MKSQVQDLIAHYNLKPHPEGGFYRETFRSTGRLACPWDATTERNYVTAIYFMLVEGNFSAFHRIKADEQWHFYEGDALEIWSITPDGQAIQKVLSNQNYQEVIPAGHWFASRTTGKYSLAGCVVAPGFDFDDFEMAEQQSLMSQFPNHSELIQQFTRPS